MKQGSILSENERERLQWKESQPKKVMCRESLDLLFLKKGDNAKARECMRDLDDLLKLLR